MKKLRLPENSDEYIEISRIDKYFKGLIIAYKKSEPIGYIQYFNSSGYWYLMTHINEEDIYPDFEFASLFDIIQYGLKNEIFDELKVIEFV